MAKKKIVLTSTGPVVAPHTDVAPNLEDGEYCPPPTRTPFVVRFPPNTVSFRDGETVPNDQIALEMAKAMAGSDHISVALPSTRDENGHYVWDIECSRPISD